MSIMIHVSSTPSQLGAQAANAIAVLLNEAVSQLCIRDSGSACLFLGKLGKHLHAFRKRVAVRLVLRQFKMQFLPHVRLSGCL